jgi:hypothetical protein
MGNADNSAMSPQTFSSSGTGPIWRAIMEAAHEGIEPHDFVVPEGVVFAPCAGRMEAFVEGTGCTYVEPKPSPTPVPHRTPRAAPTGTPAAPEASPEATPAATPPPSESEPEEPPTTPVPTSPPSPEQ